MDSARRPGKGETRREGLDIVEVDRSGPLRLRLEGELDMATAELLEEALAQARSDELHVVLDCAGLTFVDSSGVRVLVEADQLALEEGLGHTVIATPSAPFRRLIELLGLRGRLEIRDEG